MRRGTTAMSPQASAEEKTGDRPPPAPQPRGAAGAAAAKGPVAARTAAVVEALDPVFASFDVVQEAPVFHPTAEEFADPLGYIAKIRPLAEGAGMCRIIPPDGWAPPFTIDSTTFKFPTRVQNISRLGAGARLRKDFEMRLRKLMFKRGTPLAGPVQVDKKHPPVVDLYGLFKTVTKEHGGFDAVTAPEAWEEIAASINLPPTLGKALRNAYRQALLPFEQWQQHQQQQEQQPPTDAPAVPSTPSVKLETAPQPTTIDPAAAVASLTKGTRARTGSKRLVEAPAESAAYAKLVEDRRAHVGTKMVVGKKFWRYFPPQALWMRGTVTAVEKGTRIVARYDPDDEPPAATAGRKGGKKQQAEAEEERVQVRRFTEAMGKRDALVLLANGETKEGAKAIQCGEEFCEGCLRTRVFGAMAECYECGALRHAPCMEPPLKHLPFGDWFCPDCAAIPVGTSAAAAAAAAAAAVKGGKMGKGKMGGAGGMKQRKMMAGTARGDKKPPGVEELFASFGFEDGEDYTLEGYKEMADAWKVEHFGSEEVGEDAVEAEFWRVVAGGGPQNETGGSSSRFRAPGEVKVEYGSEIDTGVHGSAFPVPAALLKGSSSSGGMKGGKKESVAPAPLAVLGSNGGESKRAARERLKLYERSGWNINNLPVATGSMLHHLDVPVTGVVVPWLYVGMALSAFCWHAEDHYLYSINYMHAGNPKGWYAIPGAHADAFEALVEATWPELFEHNPDLMLQLVTMVDPRWLVSKGIPVFRARQREGQFVVTFPQAYHGGFNFGYNVAEAVNFAPPDFLPWGGKAQELYRRLHRSPVFSQDQLVMAAAKALLARPHPRETAECLPFVLTELERMRRAAARRAAAARALGVGRFVEGAKELSLDLEDEEEEKELDGEQQPGREGRRGKMGGVGHHATQKAGGQVRHGLLKGPRCAVCQQYCFMEMVHCAQCFPPNNTPPNVPVRAVCGEHIAQACPLPHAHPPSAFVYRQRCPETIMADFQTQLQQRRERLGAWSREAAAFQTGPRAPAAVQGKAGALYALLEERRGRVWSLAVEGRVLRLEAADPFVQRIGYMAGFLAPCLGEGAAWAAKPAVGLLAELHKRGRELGAPRHELKGVDAALKACQAAAEGAKRLLPEGVTKQGHLRLNQQAARRERGARGRGRPLLPGEEADEEEEKVKGKKEEEPVVAGCGGLGLEALMALIAALIDFPYKLERELSAALRLLGAVTRARRRSWELLGVRVGEEFAPLDALLAAAGALFPALKEEVPPEVGELEGAPRFYPQGIAPNGVSAEAASVVGDGASVVTAGVGGKRKPKAEKGGGRVYRMVKGRWEGRRFSFLPGPNVWLGVDRLSKELRLLGVGCPEWELLVDRGNLVLTEDVSDDEEGPGAGAGDGGGKRAGRKKGWNTALPLPKLGASSKAQARGGGKQAKGLEEAEGKTGGVGGAGPAKRLKVEA